MILSQKIKQMIKTWEGCRLRAYRCPAGVLTIGYGHTGPDVSEGQLITREEAETLFEQDIQTFANRVSRIIRRQDLKQSQFDALVSLAYNIGSEGLRRSTLLRLVEQDPESRNIYNEFMRHNKARINGVLKELPGLTRRRRAEAEHYFDRSGRDQ